MRRRTTPGCWSWIVAASIVATSAHDAGADARPGHIAFRSYGADDGLTALDVVVGTQDRDGFIWAASPNGLFRYDGERFRRFSTADGLPSSLVTDLAVAPSGVLWGATSRGLFYQQGDRFVAVGSEVLPVDGMHLLAFDTKHRTWITTRQGPFVLVAPGQLRRAPGWPGGESFGILSDRDGSMLVGRGARLLRHPPDRDEFEDVGHDFVDTITHVIRDGQGRLWVRAGQHLWMQPRANTRFEDRSPPGAIVGPTNVRLALSATQTLLVPTSRGLIEIDGDQTRLLATDLADDARNIKSVWIDREGAIWLTSLGLHQELGRGLWRTISTADGLPSNNVWSVTGLHDGRIAVGTDHGVAIIGGETVETVTDQTVVTTLEAPAGVLWIVTDSLIRYDLATRTSRTIGRESGRSDGPLTSLAVDAEGSIWFGIETGGLYRVHPSHQSHFERVELPGGEGARVWGLAVDQDRLWVTSSRGLFLRIGESWRQFTTQDGLRDNGLTFITARRNHEICVSYLSPLGLSCFRYEQDRLAGLRDIDESTGLSSPVPYFLNEDLHGRLWVGGASGISVFGDGVVDHFTRSGGAPGDDCNAAASWIGGHGDIWVGTSSGLGVFDATRYRPANTPRVTLVRSSLGDTTLDPAAPPALSPPAVPYQRGHFDVEFSALSFLDPRQLEYQVRLLGFDNKWRSSAGRDARYRRLPAGDYQFAARARYRGGTWGDATVFRFVVLAPWWESWWARGLAVGTLAILVALVIRWRSRRLVRRNRELEGLVLERTRELTTANQRVAQAEKLSALGRLLAQLSHEINNPLNVIHNNIEPLEEYSVALSTAVKKSRDLAGDPAAPALDRLWDELNIPYIIEDGAQAFAIVRHAITRIARIHGELKTFLRGEPLERELIDITECIQTSVAMLTRVSPDVEIQCEFGPLPPLLIHQGRIGQTFTNLLQNAADAMNRNGRITVRTLADDRHLHIRISDTGPGIAADVRPKIFEPFFTTKKIGEGLGLGLAICREIVVAHGGVLDVDDEHVGGTCFVISLPIPDQARRAA